MKTKQIRKKKVFLAYPVRVGRWIFNYEKPNLNGGTLTTVGGTHPSYNLSTGYISIQI